MTDDGLMRDARAKDTHHAYFGDLGASEGASEAHRESVKALSAAVLERINRRIEHASPAEKQRIKAPEKMPVLMHEYASEVPRRMVTCADCGHAEPTEHTALIRCGAGVKAPGACGLWWGTDSHSCDHFKGRRDRHRAK